MGPVVDESRFYSEEELAAKLERRQKELEVVRSELSAAGKTSRKVFVGSGPGSVLFLADRPAEVRSNVEKEMSAIKKKLAKASSAEKSSALKF